METIQQDLPHECNIWTLNIFFLAKPSAPKGLDVSALGHDSVRLTWYTPDDDLITSYRIEKREVSSGFWTLVDTVDSSTSSYTIRNLDVGKDYYFRVVAENTAGLSQPLALDKPIVPKSAYSEWILTRFGCRNTWLHIALFRFNVTINMLSWLCIVWVWRLPYFNLLSTFLMKENCTIFRLLEMS